MRFSIIVPVYNSMEYLRDTVASVYAQSCRDFELILVDDGSTDGSSGLCDELREQYGCRVIHQKNSGVGAARNAGIREALGEYLVYLDSDDFIAPEMLSELEKAIETQPADIYAFGFTTSDGERDLRVYMDDMPMGVPLTLKQNPEMLLVSTNVWGKVVRRELYLKHNIQFPSFRCGEDMCVSMRLFALAESVIFLPGAWYRYVERNTSVMRSGNLRASREIIDAFEELLGWYRREGLFETYHTQLERLCIDHVFLAASVRVLRIDPKSDLLREFRGYMEKNFPDYGKNPLIAQLPPEKKLAYRLLRMKAYRLLRLLFRLKDGK